MKVQQKVCSDDFGVDPVTGRRRPSRRRSLCADSRTQVEARAPRKRERERSAAARVNERASVRSLELG
jgi:hypothetical protein